MDTPTFTIGKVFRSENGGDDFSPAVIAPPQYGPDDAAIGPPVAPVETSAPLNPILVVGVLLAVLYFLDR